MVITSCVSIFLLCRGRHCPGVNREDDRHGSPEAPISEACAETPFLLEPGKAAPVLPGRDVCFLHQKYSFNLSHFFLETIAKNEE